MTLFNMTLCQYVLILYINIEYIIKLKENFDILSFTDFSNLLSGKENMPYNVKKFIEYKINNRNVSLKFFKQEKQLYLNKIHDIIMMLRKRECSSSKHRVWALAYLLGLEDKFIPKVYTSETEEIIRLTDLLLYDEIACYIIAHWHKIYY